MKPVIVISIAFLLTACQTTVIQKPVMQQFSVPSELLDCGVHMPPLPIADTLRDKDVGKYILSLRRIINECKLDTQTLKKYIDEYNALVIKFNEENNKK